MTLNDTPWETLCCGDLCLFWAKYDDSIMGWAVIDRIDDDTIWAHGKWPMDALNLADLGFDKGSYSVELI